MQELLGHPSMKFSKGHLLREHEQIICHIPSRKKYNFSKKKFKAKSYYVQCPKIQKMVQQLMNHFFHYDIRNQGGFFPTHNIFTKNHFFLSILIYDQICSFFVTVDYVAYSPV